MGKNKGKRGKRTEYSKMASIMRKLDNEINKEYLDKKRNSHQNKNVKDGDEYE